VLPWLRRILPYTWPIRVALGLMFLVSAAGKLGDLNAVVAEVRQYGLLPEPLPIPFGYALPFGELALGITLFLGLFTRLAAAGGALLMVAFMVAIAFRLLTAGSAADCGCFGLLGQEPLTWWTFARDVVFLVGLAGPLLDTALWVSADRYFFGWGDDATGEGPEEDAEEPEPQPTSSTKASET
jgi:uncharacterized membrane protein YphA (DoxX/SURF4 family)